MCDCQNRGNNFLTGLVFGALAGVGLVYFLTSTKEGKKIGEKALDELGDLIDELEEKSEEFKQKAGKVQEALAEKAGSATALSQIEKLRERGRRAVKSFLRNGKPLT